MSALKKILLGAAVLLLATGCATYTVATGLEKISIPSDEVILETRYSVIQEMAEAERKAQEEAFRIAEAKKAAEDEAAAAAAEAQRIAEEAERAAREEKARAQEELMRSIEAVRSRNDFPQDPALLTYPHIFRPLNTDERLSASFTRLDVLLLPLGSATYTAEEISRIANAIADINVSFMFITGSTENQIALANTLQRDAVALEGGMVIFTPEIRSATSTSALFTVADGKEVGVSVLDISDDMVKAESLDIPAWQEYLRDKADEELALIDSVTASIEGTSRIFALSSSEPSTLDWTIFTPYSYRSDYSWTISDAMAESWSDTYRATHFSEETDSGITLKTPSVSERMDFLYTQGVMEVSSDTIPVGILSEGDTAVYALIATYIIP